MDNSQIFEIQELHGVIVVDDGIVPENLHLLGLDLSPLLEMD